MARYSQGTATQKITYQVEDLRTSLLKLLQHDSATLKQAEDLIVSLIEETRVSLEELQVTDEELRQQNEQLAQSRLALEIERHHYHDLFDAAPVGYLVTNVEGMIQEGNQAAATLLNVPLSHLIGKPLVVFIPGEDRPLFRQQLIELTSSDEVKTWETHIRPRHSTEVRDIAFTVARVLNQIDRRRGVSLRWLVEDITVRKLAETYKLNHFFRESFEHAAVGIAHIGHKGYWLRVNQKLCDLLGYSREELLALDPRIVTHPDDAALSTELEQQLINGNLDSASIEKRFLRKNGETVWTHLTISAVHNAAGEYDYSIAVINDITERKRLMADEREQRALADALRDTAMTLTSTLDFEEVLDHIVATISRIVPQEAASILLAEEDGFHIVRGWGYNQNITQQLEAALKNLGVQPTDNSIFDHVATTKQPVIFSNWEDHEDWETIPDIRSIRSLICVPIIVRDDVIGFLELHSSTPHFFTNHHGEHLQIFAAQAAIAIQNARAHQQALLLAAHEERQRLARDLHDAVTQTLFTASLISESLLRLGKKKPEQIWQHLEKLHQLNRGALAEMRTLLVELRPDYLLKMHLSTQLHQLADAVKSRKDIDIVVTAKDDIAIPPETQIVLYRIAQEALNNVVKHSHASSIEIGLHNHNGKVILFIRDNGNGFDPQKDSSGMGMDTMQERAASINASLQISTAFGRGTEIAVTWNQTAEV